MSTLIIHAGTHKTATTAIQETLRHNRARLAAQGIVYPAIGSAAGHHLLVAEWMAHLEPYRDGRPPEAHWQALIARYSHGPATVILSSEEFSRKAPEHVDMQALHAYASAFGARRIVFMLRNQLAYIQSLILEMQRQYRMPGVGDYVKQCLAGNHASGMFLDYGALYDHARAAFPAEEIRLVSYEAMAGSGQDIAAALLETLGLLPPGLTLEAPPDGRANVSPEPLAAWAANRVTAPAIAGTPMVRLATEAFAAEFGATARSTLFTPAEAAAIRAHFEPMNRRLEARYRAIEPQFTLAPIRMPDGLIHRGQVGAGFWLRIARQLHAAHADPERRPRTAPASSP